MNMDILLIMALICLNICMFIAEMCMEGSGSQNFDLGHSFYFMLCRRRHFEKNINKSQKLPVFFYHYIKTKA